MPRTTRSRTTAISASWRTSMPARPRPPSASSITPVRATKLAEVHEGAATMDWMEQEQERGITITSAATTAQWNGKRHQHHRHAGPRGFHHRGGALAARPRRRGMRARFQPGRRAADRNGMAARRPLQVPRIVFCNKMDKTGADFFQCLKDIVDRLGAKPVAIQLPIGAENQFKGLIDLVRMDGVVWDEETLGAKYHATSKSRPTCSIRPRNIAKSSSRWPLRSTSGGDGGLSAKANEPERSKAEAAHPQGDDQQPLLSGFSAVPPLRTRACSRSSTAFSDYLPSPVDIPTDQGHRREDREPKRCGRACRTVSLLSIVLAFKIMNDPFVGSLDLPAGFIRAKSRRACSSSIR